MAEQGREACVPIPLSDRRLGVGNIILQLVNWNHTFAIAAEVRFQEQGAVEPMRPR